MPKPTLAYALASQPLLCLNFGGTTTTSSVYLPGPGGIAADGVPIPYSGTLAKLILFDGTNIHSDGATVTFAANDRISVYCQNVGGSFTVKVRINGISSTLQVTSVPLNSTLQATVVFAINRT